MFESFRNIFKIPELRKRIFFTIALILVYRIGRHLPTPGIDLQVLHDIMGRVGTGGSDLLGLIDMFSGGPGHHALHLQFHYLPGVAGCGAGVGKTRQRG
jgi:preprotein translocase subunit SecY